MGEQTLKDILLKLLDDKDVIEKIRSLCQEKKEEKFKNIPPIYCDELENSLCKMDQEKEEYTEIKEKVSHLKNELDKKDKFIMDIQNKLKQEEEKYGIMEKEIEKKDFQIKELESRNKDFEGIRGRLEEEKNIISKELNELRIFEKWKETFIKFNNLNEEKIKSLKGIFNGDSVLDFIYCGVQESNINNFWDYIKDRALNESDELEILEAIFNEFFKAINRVYENGMYETQEVNIDDEFDDDYYIRTSNSNPVGTIKKVLLKGYVQKGNKKIIKKSIVQI